jgi:hypothetical protein
MSESSSAELHEIVLALQAEICRRQPPVPTKVNRNRLRTALARVGRYQHVQSHLPIGWPTMPDGVLPKVSIYVKKVTRRLLRWYINPIVDQQNLFNEAVVDMLAELTTEIEELMEATAMGQDAITEADTRTTYGRPGAG